MRTIRKIWLDVVLGTLFIFAFMWGLSNMTAFKIFDVFDPIGDALGDFELTDIVFSQFRETPVADERIVIVNLSSLGRGDIAMMLNIINQYNPAVIGIDSFFYTPKEDSIADMMLAEAFASIQNLVLVSKLYTNPESDKVDSIITSWPLFTQFAEYQPFATLDTEAEEQDDLKFCRSFWPKIDVNGERQVCFAARLASYLDSAAVEEFLARPYDLELVNFKGNVMDYGATKFGTAFFALDWIDVFQENFTPEMIEGKIVLFAYLGEELGDRKNFEDKFITPLNAKYAGRTLPDMYGGVIHANIISSILNREYINYMTDEQGYIAAVILCLLNVFLFTLIYKKIPKWYDGITKLVQLIEIFSFYFIIIQVFNVYEYRLNLTIGIIAVALAGDSLEIYHGVLKNAFTKEGRRSLFKADKL